MFSWVKPGKDRNVMLFYVLTASTNLWFGASNWLYVWRRFMSFGELGWVDGIGFGFSVLLEVPSGAVADLLGKRITLIISNISALVGILLIAFGNSLWEIFIGNMITQFGWALYSGASEAMVYDSLVDIRKEHMFSQVLAKSNLVMSYAAAFGYFFGGFLYDIHWRLPHIIWGLSYIPGVIASILIVEPVSDTEKFTFKGYLNKITLGTKELFIPQLRKYLLIMFILLGVYFLYTWGFIRPAIATSFGFYSKEQSIILPALTLASAYLIQFLPAIKKRLSTTAGLTILSIMLAFGFILSAFPIGYWGIVPMLLIALAGKFSGPWISILVNEQISSAYRATTLSTVALFSKIPYVVGAVVIGSAFEQGNLVEFCYGLGITIICATLLSYIIIRKNG